MYSYNQMSYFGVSHLGGKCNLTIYISNINRGDIVTGLEAIRKEGTIIRTEFRARCPNPRVDTLYTGHDRFVL